MIKYHLSPITLIDPPSFSEKQKFSNKIVNNLKIPRQIDLVLQYLANDCCNLTNFSSEFVIRKTHQIINLAIFVSER